MLAFGLWYLAISVLGLAVFPLAYRLLPALPDRGYAISRSLGLMLWGYLFWLLASLQVVRNDLGGQLFALLILLLAAGITLRRTGWRSSLSWLKAQSRLVVAVEIVFLAAFALMALIRAGSPDITYTEKPMEMAFINAILRSPTLPAQDPWLSGYAISYYHFGYILVAMLARLTGTPGAVAFNLAIALVFGLAAIGAYGVVYNLTAAYRRARNHTPEGLLWVPLFGPLFALVLGNLEGLLEVLHHAGLFWKQGQSSFWSWLNIIDLTTPPAGLAWEPRNYGTGSWWWWRASRVLQDFTYDGSYVEVIDEFPAFSYLLADLHPHVLAMPFAFLGMALALNLFLGGAQGRSGWPNTLLEWKINPETLGMAALLFGGLGFMNLWDFPIYVALFAGAYALLQAYQSGWNLNRLGEFAGLSLAIILLGVGLYLPFYIGFASQAGGFLPSLIYFTRGAHFWVMFGVLLIPLMLFLAFLWARYGSFDSLRNALAGSLIVLALLAAFTLVLVLGIQNLDRLQGLNPMAGMAENAFLSALRAPTNEMNEYMWQPLLQEALRRRIDAPGAWLTLGVLLAAGLGLLLRAGTQDDEETEAVEEQPVAALAFPPTHAFIMLPILLGTLLALVPEFFYLRDFFGSRMNTIFKFYIQAWLLWSVAVAYGTGVLLTELRRGWAVLLQVVLLAVIAAGLVFPSFWGWEKLQGLRPRDGWSLNGMAYLERSAPDEAAAIHWLKSQPVDVMVEAVAEAGGSYTDFARISVYSGQPTVLGWVGHESQWRGGSAEMGSRKEEIALLYTTRSWDEASTIIERYGVRYIVIGPREHEVYRVNVGKFQSNLVRAFEQGGYVIYQVPSTVVE